MTNRVGAKRRHLLASIGVLTFATTAPAVAQDAPTGEIDPPANAETQDEAAQASDPEIVVTARRRSEVLLEVPIAVTAYSGEQLERQGATDITELADTTPNVTLEPSRGTNSTLTAFIRGIGQQDPVAGFEQGVGIYLDDVYLNRPQAAVLDVYDVERIEILRGPQGTLYGRNTLGGAVKYVTRRLSDLPELRARANLGTYEQVDLIVSASTPIASGLRIGASAARLTRGGFGKNLTTGKDNYDKNIIAVRGTAELEPSDQLFIRLSGDYSWDNSNARGGHRLIPGLLSGAPLLEDVFDTRGGLVDPEQNVKGGGAALHGEIGIAEGLNIRSVTAYRQDDSGSPIDFDALAAVDFDVPAIYENNQFSQELQLVYERGRLNGIIGGYYLNADSLTAFDVRLFTTLNGFAAHTNSKIDTETSAIFADFSYDVTDQFSVSLGGRYTWDKRIGDILRQSYLGGGSTLFGGLQTFAGAPATDFEGSRKFKKFTPRASVSFKPADDHHLYAGYSKGFKGGGFDPRGSNFNAPDLDGDGTVSPEEGAEYIGFDPETVDNYEVGYKASLLDRRLSVALAAFHADYSDVQIPGSVPCIQNGLPNFCGVIDNAGKARFRGFEAETNSTLARDFGRPGDRLGFAATLGYINAEFLSYETFIAGQGTVDVADFRQVQNTPKWTASGSLDYTTPLAGGRLNANSTLSYRSKTYQFEIPVPQFDQKAYALLDANITWRSPGDRYFIGLHGKNLMNKEYQTSGYNFLRVNPVTGAFILANGQPGISSPLGREGVLTAFYGNPRQVFLSLGANF